MSFEDIVFDRAQGVDGQAGQFAIAAGLVCVAHAIRSLGVTDAFADQEGGLERLASVYGQNAVVMTDRVNQVAGALSGISDALYRIADQMPGDTT